VAEALQTSADANQLSVRLMEAVAWQESRFRQGAISHKGARGVMQLMPDTARSLGIDAQDLGANVRGGAVYMARLLKAFDGDVILALAAYNAGPEAVRRFGGVPPYAETRAFVAAVLDRLSDAAKAPAGPALR
jgi:soluble lytic murein transglycosylase-like protein